jgi:hypothetical protein
MHSEDLVVLVGGQEVIVGNGELGTHQKSQYTSKHKESEGGQRIP